MVVFLQLGSAKGCGVLRQAKMRNGGIVLLAVLNLYVGTRIGVASFDTNRSVTDSTPTVSGCCSPEASRFGSPVSQHSRPETVDVSAETISLSISLRSAADCYV
jgi:hypothetical protein